MTTLGELLAGLDDDTVVERVRQLHPDQGTDGYRQVLATLRQMVPERPPYVLSLGWVDNGDERWVSVTGQEDGTHYAIEYEPWARWLGMLAGGETLRGFPVVDIVAHALWEMTYAGFDEATIAERLQEI